MVFNPAGFQPVYGDRYDIVTGYARAVISGGQFCFVSGAAAVVSSGVNSFNPVTDLLFAPLASGNQVTGIALFNAGSNEPIAIARRGTFLVTAEEDSIIAGNAVDMAGADSIRLSDGYAAKIGRVLTSASSGGYALLDLNTA